MKKKADNRVKHRNRGKKLMVGILFLCLLLAGCGRKSNSGASVEETTESIDFVAEYQNIEKSDLFVGEWKCGELLNSERFMGFTDYIPNVFPVKEDDEGYTRGIFVDSRNMYSLNTYYALGEEGRYHDTSYLYVLDGVTKEVRTLPITYQKEDGIEWLMLDNPYLCGGGIFSTNFSSDEDGILSDYYIAEIREDGTMKRKINLIDIATDKHMLPEPHCVPEMKLYYEPSNDRYYLISPQADCMFLIDNEGKIIADMEETDAKEIRVLVASEEGRLIFTRDEADFTTCFYYDGEEKKILFSGQGQSVGGTGMCSVDMHGRLLYTQNTTVIEWDTKGGSRERLYVDSASDENSYDYIDCVMRNTNGEVLTLRNNNLRVLTSKGPAKQVTVEIKPLLYYDDILRRSIKKYEQTHPGVTMKLLEASEWNSRDRDIIELVQDMAEGGGPDVLLMDRSQMLSFDKNDCLMDLSEVLVDSTGSQLVQGVLDYGRTKHGVMLLSYKPRQNTVIVNQKYLKGKTWTAQDIVNIVECREKEGKPFTLLTRGAYHPFFLFNTAVCDSEFVDLDAGTCSFDSELFIKVLEICKRYNKEIDYNEDAYRQLKEDEILTLTPIDMNLRSYSEIYANLGDKYVTVGYPSVSGNGNHMDFSLGFAINKNTENYEVITDFINWMFSLENEGLIYQAPVRKDLYEGRIIEGSKEKYGTDEAFIRVGSNDIWPLATKTDGSSYVEDYMELVNESRYETGAVMGYEIQSILWEEAEAFFEGNKPASEVAKTIQARVSLYLQENL